MTTTYDEPDPPRDLARKLATIANEIGVLSNDASMKQGGDEYSYVSITALSKALREKLGEAGIAIVPTATHTTHREEVESARGTKGEMVAVHVRWTITDGTEAMFAESEGQSIDYSDKALNKAVTYARRNLLLPLFNIASEDPEGERPEAQGGRSGRRSSPPSGGSGGGESSPAGDRTAGGASKKAAGFAKGLLSAYGQREGTGEDALTTLANAVEAAGGRPDEVLGALRQHGPEAAEYLPPAAVSKLIDALKALDEAAAESAMDSQ